MPGEPQSERRSFRTQESIGEERITRGMVVPFLEARGFTNVDDQRSGASQTIAAVTDAGEAIRMSVRLCWRMDAVRAKRALKGTDFAAAQLIAKVAPGEHLAAIEQKVARETEKNLTHTIIVERLGSTIRAAAMIPLERLADVWSEQQRLYASLGRAGKLGNRTKNPAENGDSPTLYLRDDMVPDIGNSLWRQEGVVNLARLDVELTPITEVDALVDSYSPSGKDTRIAVEREILCRRGQERFRNALRARYGDRCAVTGCSLLAVLEAAHIVPYRGHDDHAVQNGLLLRADIHTLFDLNLIGINPVTFEIEVHGDVRMAYPELVGARLRHSPEKGPSLPALKYRFDEIRTRLNHDGSTQANSRSVPVA